MINELIRDIPVALNISDDVIVLGKTQAQHDAALQAVFSKICWSQPDLKQEVWVWQKEHHIFWVCVLRQGISPDPKKVEATVVCEAS